MLVDDNLVPDGCNGQLDPYFIKLIVQSPTGSLGKECKSFMNCLLVNWFCSLMFGNDSNSPYQPSTVVTNFCALFTTLQLNYRIHFTMKEFTGFPGGVDAVTKEFWSSQEMIDTTFGACPNHNEITVEDAETGKAYLHNKKQFNLYNPYNLLQALFFVNGVFLMLHGCEEHCNMQHSNHTFGVYKVGHEFAGQEFVWAMTENIITKINHTSLCKLFSLMPC